MKIRAPTTRPGLLGKLLAAVGGAILLAVGVLFSLVILAVIAVAGLAAWAYFWWKTRKVRQAMREQASCGQVIDGEAVVINEFEEDKIAEREALPKHLPPR